MVTKSRARAVRVPTHVRGLDTVLSGGLLRGGVYVVRGAPGSGKTILGNQICFAHARRGGQAAYVTLLAESHARMMVHLEDLEFFDADLAEDGVRYLSAYNALTNSGLPGVLDFIRAEVPRKRKPPRRKSEGQGETILIIDGFLVISDASDSTTQLKKFIQELQLYAELAGATVILLAGPLVDESRPEYTMVDGIIELREDMQGLKAFRQIRVRKLRGGPHLRGGHLFQIANDGITIHPRVEALYATPSSDDGCGATRVTSGLKQLDHMLGGGLRRGTTTLVLGASGSGKTTFGLHYIAATPKDEKAIWFGFYETPARIIEKARTLNLRLEARTKRGDIELVWQPSTEQNVDALAQRLLDSVDKLKASRVFIDGLDGFQRATLHSERVHNVFTAIANELRVRGVTTAYTFEVPKFLGTDIDAPVTGVSALAENLVYLRFVDTRGQPHRLLSILKVRDSAYDPLQRYFRITERGIEIDVSRDGLQTIVAANPIQ